MSQKCWISWGNLGFWNSIPLLQKSPNCSIFLRKSSSLDTRCPSDNPKPRRPSAPQTFGRGVTGLHQPIPRHPCEKHLRRAAQPACMRVTPSHSENKHTALSGTAHGLCKGGTLVLRPWLPALRAQILKKISISLEIFNLAWKFQSRLKFSILTSRNPPKNRGLAGGSLEIFNLAWNFQDLEFFNLWALTAWYNPRIPGLPLNR